MANTTLEDGVFSRNYFHHRKLLMETSLTSFPFSAYLHLDKQTWLEKSVHLIAYVSGSDTQKR